MNWKEEIANASSRQNAGYVADECYRQTGKEYDSSDIDFIRNNY